MELSKSKAFQKAMTCHKELIFLILFVVFTNYIYIRHNHKFSNNVVLNGDEWEYHSLAVNLAYGHGYRSVQLEEFEKYKFLMIKGNIRCESTYKRFIRPSEYDFDRTPGYPMFLALIYGIFGVHPFIVKIFQTIIMAASYAFMPVIGSYYWGWKGTVTGIISSLISAKWFTHDPTRILTEPLTLFNLVLIALSITYCEEKFTFTRGLILGLLCSSAVLMKGINLPISIFLFFYLIVKSFTARAGIIPLTSYFLGVIFFILPWTLFISRETGSFVFLSTQLRVELLDSYNEESIVTGRSETAWRILRKNDKGHFFHRISKKKYRTLEGTLESIRTFLEQNMDKIPSMIATRFRNAFLSKSSGYFKLDLRYTPWVIGMLLFYLVSWIGRWKGWDCGKEKIPVFPVIYFFNLLVIIIIFYGISRFTKFYTPFFVLPTIYLGLESLNLIFHKSYLLYFAFVNKKSRGVQS